MLSCNNKFNEALLDSFEYIGCLFDSQRCRIGCFGEDAELRISGCMGGEFEIVEEVCTSWFVILRRYM